MTPTEQRYSSPQSAQQRVTPEMIDFYMREGQRLRGVVLGRAGRQLIAAVRARLGRGRRMGRLEPRAVR